MSDSIKFPLFPKHELSCDIVLGARFRNFAPERNWEHWQLLIDLLHCEGLNVGIAGTKGGCYNLQADVYAWDHTRGHTEGSVDLLKNCKVYCGIDSGVTHLASFLDTNSVIFRREYPGNYDLTGMFRRANKGKYMQLEDSAWDNPFTIAKGVIDAYSSCSIGK
jgi:ADP-heptose:LPS heptosyltransferase